MRVLETLDGSTQQIIVSDSFGHWLAGFIDGEGCFSIAQIKDTYTCRFGIELRLDDEEILQEICRLTKLGRLQYRQARNNSQAQVSWYVSKKSECQLLVSFLEKYPLRAKKARDFEIWKQAVLYTASISKGGIASDWVPMAQWKKELSEIRKYIEH